MQYAEARPTIRSGDLLAFSHGDWKSWRGFKTNMVRMFTRSTYSHVGIAWRPSGVDRVFVLEAVKDGGTRLYPLSISGDFYLLPMRAYWGRAAEDFALDNLGAAYSEIDAIRAFFGPLEPGRISECAAYALAVYRADGIDLGNRATPDAVVMAAQAGGSELIFVSNGGSK